MIAVLLAAGCGNGTAPQPDLVDGYLILQKPDGSRAEFAWGEYQTIDHCAEDMAESFAATEDGDELKDAFWTNKAFNEGGDETPGWDRNFILGTRCERKPGAKAPEVKEVAAVSGWSTGGIIFGTWCAFLLVALGWGVFNDWKD